MLARMAFDLRSFAKTLYTAGIVAAAVFVKNPATQQHAQDIFKAVNPLLQEFIDELPENATPATPAAGSSTESEKPA